MGDTPPRNNLGVADATGVTLAGKIMVGTIVTLFFVVVVILGIHLYARLYLWRRSGARRRRFEFDSVEEMSPTPTEGLTKGVDPEILKSLPVMVFSSVEFKDGLECAVCLSEVADGEKARLLPNCKHGFHVGCIDMWLQSHSNCPLCRSPVSPTNAPTTDNNLTPADGAVNFPTNVLFWGNEVQVSSRIVTSEEGTSTSRPDECLVIDIPRNDTIHICSLNEQEEVRSPLSARFRSLTRIWSMNKRVAPSTSSESTYVEQGDGECLAS